MVALESLIDTLRERLKTEAVVRVPASLEEYFELIQDCEFDVEYIDHEIVATMSQASEIHELLVANFIGLLFIKFQAKSDCRVYCVGWCTPNSNRWRFLCQMLQTTQHW